MIAQWMRWKFVAWRKRVQFREDACLLRAVLKHSPQNFKPTSTIVLAADSIRCGLSSKGTCRGEVGEAIETNC